MQMTAQRCGVAQDLSDAAEVAFRGPGPLRQRDHDRRHGPQPRDAVLPDQPQVLAQLERLHHAHGDVETGGEEHWPKAWYSGRMFSQRSAYVKPNMEAICSTF